MGTWENGALSGRTIAKLFLVLILIFSCFQACDKNHKKAEREPQSVSYTSCQNAFYCRQFEGPPNVAISPLTQFEQNICENSGGTFATKQCPKLNYCGSCEYDKGDSKTKYSYITASGSETESQYAATCVSFGGVWTDNPAVECGQ